MPRFDLNERLFKLQIPFTRYDTEKAALQALPVDSEGKRYSDYDVNRLILRKSSQKTIQTLCECHGHLIKEPYTLTIKQLVRIASNNGGSKNLIAILENLTNLLRM